MQTLTPHVYWAQRHSEIYLRVELCDAKVSEPVSDDDDLSNPQTYKVRQLILLQPAIQ